jgi:predicted SprT family Zn-dependent metalloprotease
MSQSATSDTESNEPQINAGKHKYWEIKCKKYLTDWYEQTPPKFEIDLSKIEITVTARMTRAWGKFKVKRSPEETEQQLRISRNAIDEHGFDEVKQTIRHEAVHAYQHQNDYGLSHGFSFTRWCDEFDISVHKDNPSKEANYHIICENCGIVGKRQQRSKIVKNPERYKCGKCGEKLRSERNN